MFQSCCDLTGARKEEKVEALQKLISLPSRKDGQEIRALGIDLGTTNSTAAEVIWKIGEPLQCRVLEVDQPTEGGLFTSPLVPSVFKMVRYGLAKGQSGSAPLVSFSPSFLNAICFMKPRTISD